MSEGGIIRVEKNKNYFAASNKPFNDKRLSWAARGVIGYLLSKPSGWQLRVKDLINQKGAGRKGVRSILKELETCGYLVRKKVRQPEGTYTWISTVYENARAPQPLDGAAMDGKGVHGEENVTRGPQPYHGVGVDIVSTESLSTERATAGKAPASPSGRTPSQRARSESSGRTPSSRASRGVPSKKLKKPKKQRREKEQERISEEQITEVRDAFALYGNLANWPDRGDPRYADWRKGYKELAAICASCNVHPELLAIGCAMKRDEIGFTPPRPGSYVKIADFVGATLAREGLKGDLMDQMMWYYRTHGELNGWPIPEKPNAEGVDHGRYV